MRFANETVDEPESVNEPTRRGVMGEVPGCGLDDVPNVRIGTGFEPLTIAVPGR